MPPAVLVDLGFILSFLARLSIAATVRLSCREISAGLAPDAISLSSRVSWSDVHGGLAIDRREVIFCLQPQALQAGGSLAQRFVSGKRV
jgi:hypothetical protein